MHSLLPIPHFPPPLRRRTSFLQLFTTFCLFTLLFSDMGQATTSSQATTVFDGVTQDKYIQYLKLDGTNGATIPIPDGSSLNTNLEYTFMMWFKPMSDSWGTRLQYAFRFPSSFECYFSAPNSLICESAEQCDKLIASTSNVYQNQWAHLTVSGHPAIGSYIQLESHTDIISSDTKTYVIFRQTAWGWTACVGNCLSQYGFIGGLREFKYLNQYTTPQTASRIKNHYLMGDTALRAYYRFNSDKYFNKDQYKGLYATMDSSAVPAIDYMANDICFPPSWQKEQYIAFNQDRVIASSSFSGKFTTKTTDYAYSLSTWLRISPDSCTQANPNTAKTSCFIFQLNEVVMLYLDKRNSAKFYFFALQNYYESQSTGMFVPDNSWINIQLVLTQFQGYEIRIYDLLGRMTYYETLTQNMQEQRSNGQFDLFTNFRGHARNFIMYAEKRTLPITSPDMVTPTSLKITNSNALVYYIFQPAYITGNALVGQTQNNMGSSGYFPMFLSGTPTYEWVTWKTYGFNSGSTDGLVTYPQNLFDGIACNDNFQTLQFTGKTSYVQAQTPQLQQWLTGATVEFWFRPANFTNATDYLFSLYGQSSTHEFFSMYLDNNKILNCGPFGVDSTRSPLIQYLDYTETNRLVYRWFHITCQYEYQKEVTGYLFNAPLDQKYVTSLASNPSYVPADKFNVILGNTNAYNRGTPSLFVKELRVWPYKRSYSDIQGWRYRQIDPKSFAASYKLLAYLRLTEGGYSEYNFASAANSSVPSTVISNAITYASNQEITICPQQTYYMNNLCYLNPVKLAVPAVFPDIDSTNGQLYWILTANHSSLVNQSYATQLQMQWQSSDPVLQSFIATSSNKYDLRIPASALRDSNTYPLMLNITNLASTFLVQQSINFVPISCKYYTVDGSNAYSSYNNYTQSQASNDISFNLKYNEMQSYCNSITFFNDLQPTVTVVISPAPAQTPIFSYVFNADKSISVTLPKAEQSKLAIKTDVKILFQIYWTNTQYANIINTQQYHFQDVLYTINFNYEMQTVMPILTASTNAVLQGEQLNLDASGTYITGYNNGDQGSLQFLWTCDNSIQTLCNGISNQLLSIPYASFQTAGGLLNRSYQFQVQVVWTQSNGTVARFYASQSVIWYNIQSPAFTLTAPQYIRATADNQQFQIAFTNYDNQHLQDLTIAWSIVPNLTLPSYYNITNNSTLLTVPKGAFSQLTKYTLTVSAQNKLQAIAFRQRSITFTTSQPPFGGSATITPNTGYLSSTQFSVSVSNWQSSNRPIQFRVWSTTTYLGNELKDLITSDWVAETNTFEFFAQSTNPFQVEISDATFESSFIKLSPTITAQTTNLLQMLTNAVQVENDYSLKYTYLSAIVNTFQNIENVNTSDTQSYPQTDYIQTMIDSIVKDLSNINNTKSLENGDAYTVVQNSVSMLSHMLQDSTVINDNIVEQSLQILDSVQATQSVFTQLIQESDDFSKSYALALSYIFKYSDRRAYSVFTNRLLSADSSSQQGILEMNQRIKDQKDKLMGYLCNYTQVNVPTTEIVTPAFDLQVQKFSLDRSDDVSFSFSDEPRNFLNTNVATIASQALSQHILSDTAAFCVQTTHYKLNLKPLSKDQRAHISPYSPSILEFQVTDQTGLRVLNDLNLKGATTLQFNVDPTTFVNNQTVCMAYTSNQGWSDSSCQTTVNVQNKSINCQCNMIDNQLYTLFTDTTRLKGQPLFTTTPIVSESTYDKILAQYTSASISYLGIILILIGLGVGFTAASMILDKKDRKAYSRPLDGQRFDLLKQVAATSNQPLGLWIYKQDQAYSYCIPNKSTFSHMLTQLHPVFNILQRFDITQPRLQRFSLYFLQVSAYALFCICYFGASYRNGDLERNDSVIDPEDVGSIFGFGILGMIVLLPIPYANTLLKSQLKDQVPDVSVNPNYHNEQTQEQLSNQVFRGNDTDTFKKALEDLHIQPRFKWLNYTLISLSYIVALIAIVVAISINYKIALSNQYCSIATFYFGFFGNLFIAQTLKVLLNSTLSEKLLDNKTSLLRFILSSDAVMVLQDKKNVKAAEKQLQFKEPNEQQNQSDQSMHKTEQDEPVQLEHIDIQSNRNITGPHEVSVEDDMASISMNNEVHVHKSVDKYMSSPSPMKKSYMKSEEDSMRKSIGIFDRASQGSGDKSEHRYSCVTDTNKAHKRA